jgi:integrase
VEILKARQGATASGFVFPGPGTSGHMVEPKKAIIRVMERAGIPYRRYEPNDVNLHDLRRTLGSWQATAIYARLDPDPVRAAVNTATAAMMEAGGMNEVAEVVQLPKRGNA